MTLHEVSFRRTSNPPNSSASIPDRRGTAQVPVTSNATSSEFEVGRNGVGLFFAPPKHSPCTPFENVQIFHPSGMQTSKATLVAAATLVSTPSG